METSERVRGEAAATADASALAGASASVDANTSAGASAPAVVAEPAPLKFRVIGPVIRAAGLVPWTVAFAALFVVATFIVAAVEPGVDGLANAAWLMFQVVTTIGLGDFTCATLVGRAMAIALSVYSVFFLALVTGAVVAYCQERMRARRDASVAHFIDQLEHLPDLSPAELADLSEKVKDLNRR